MSRRATSSGRGARTRGGYGMADFRTRGHVSPQRRLKPSHQPEAEDGRFRVLIAVHRPRFRSRAERAVNAAGWEVRSLLNKEDPIGLLNQRTWRILILSDDFGRQKSLALFHAAQRFRPTTKIIGVFEDEDSREVAATLADAAFSPPWKSNDLRTVAGAMYREVSGQEPVFGAAESDSEESPG